MSGEAWREGDAPQNFSSFLQDFLRVEFLHWQRGKPNASTRSTHCSLAFKKESP
jgi:hypothetical protein